ncbi:MAG: hypothetical protein RLZZ215_264 [Pseudomonadota bacterium]|jgi:hypothetical protein
MQAVASLRYGVIFKKAFSQPDVIITFVRDILGIELIIDHVETEKSSPSTIGNIANHYDLFAENKVNRIIVDIQHRPMRIIITAFYTIIVPLYWNKLCKLKITAPILAVYTIVVLTLDDKHARDMASIDFAPKDSHGIGLGEIPHKIFYLCPKYLNHETPETLREWMLAINDSLDEEVDKSAYHNQSVQKILRTIHKDTRRSRPHER